ncbi:MAG: TVP38/TMEM64 family protein [Nitrospirota bacterium]|nr:MAG: TVP38/TMEM64 family protein [Nitrospirota bacterium]
MKRIKFSKKMLAGMAVILLVLLLRMFNVGHYFSLEYIKESQVRFGEVYAQSRVTVIGIYMFIYIAVTSLSLPGAAVLTIGSGALFGLVTGVILVSFSSTIGATIACFASRYILRDWVQKRFGIKIKKINEGIEREGAFYLFTLRLIPLFPFWMINLVAGVTRIPLRKFFWVSQIGMLPGTIVYVNAGREIAKIDSLSGILSPGLIISFVILGIFPLAVKKAMAFYRKRTGRSELFSKDEDKGA